MSLNDYLTSLTSRLAAVETKLGLPVGKTPMPAAPGAGGASLEAFDEFVSTSVAPFVATSSKIGGKVEKLGAALNDGVSCVRGFIEMAGKSKKPSDVAPMLKPIQDAVVAIQSLRDRDEFENHAKAVAEGAAALMWVNPAITLPGPHCNDAVEASVFWTNKVRQEWKAKEGGEPHVQWCTELSALLKGMAAYVKANSPTGVTWNPNGGEASAGASSAPKAAPKASVAAPSAGKPVVALTDVFAQLSQIDQSSGKTAGLNHVTKDMKASAQKERSSVVPANIESKKPPAKKWGGDGGPPQNVEPKFELVGNKWVVQGQEGLVELKEDQVNVKQTIYIFGCKGATVVIGGKCNTITIDGCQKTKVVFENALALCEAVNCRQIQVQVKGKCPSAAVDKTDGYTLYLSRAAAAETKIVSSKSSDMNVECPISEDPDAEYKSYAIPEQFFHKFNADFTAVSSEVSDLYHAG